MEFSKIWKQWRAQYPERDLSPREDDGENLQTIHQFAAKSSPRLWRLAGLRNWFQLHHMLGNGERLIQWVHEHFPNAPNIVYKKHVGSAVAYDFTQGWMRQLVLGEKPDLVILYSEGKGPDLEKLLADFRTHCAADIIVASLHLRQRAKKNTPATVNNQQWQEVRAVAKKYGCEWVDNRVEHAAYLAKHNKPLEWLLKDAVHQSDHGALVINENIVRHIAPQETQPLNLINEQVAPASTYRIDLYGTRAPDGEKSQVYFDGKPAADFPAFITTVILPGTKNHKPARGSAADRSPHMVKLGASNKLIPQQWQIRMTSDTGDYQLTGSVTGVDGEGNSANDFTSRSGQITVPTELWRRRINADGTHSNRTGDVFTWEVKRSTLQEVDFRGKLGEPFRVTLGDQLPGKVISIGVESPPPGAGTITGYEYLNLIRYSLFY